MIIHEVSLHNFGIYGGDITFELTPLSNDNYNRPLIIFRGKNGVGKSSLVEAIRLCLHGSLALGNRVSQREYEKYLERRIYHQLNSTELLSEAYVKVSFDYIIVGRRQEYTVIRNWERRGTGILTAVNIWQNGVLLNASAEEKEHLLRELIPPGIADTFFFDGEKIATLAEAGDEGNLLLADTIKNLLGLHLVEQLDRDLDVYLTRQDDIRDLQAYQTELEALREEEDQLRQQQTQTRDMLAHCSRHLSAKRHEITRQEQRIVSEGGNFALNEQERQTRQQQLKAAITAQTQRIHELCRGLLPFTVAPKLLHSLRNRLEREADYQRWVASQSILNELQLKIEEAARQETYWEGVAPLPDEQGQQTHLRQIVQLLRPYTVPTMAEAEVIHYVSAEEHSRLLSWIDEALNEGPRQLAAAIHQWNTFQTQLQAVNDDLAKVPVNQIIEPLLNEVRRLEREVGRLEAEYDRLLAEENLLSYHLERNASSKRRVSQQIADANADDGRLRLAARTKLLLEDYQQQIAERKLQQLGTLLMKRFNQLCRKRMFIERVEIDPANFGVTLYRAGQPFPRTQLSAGEQQLFAVATLWALHEMSRRPLPVIIDTPLSRLDEEHRQSMLSEFFPQVAHQVIVLATDSEIDDKSFTYLAPAISRAYWLSDVAESGAAHVQDQPIAKQHSLIRLQEIDIHAT